MKTDAAREELLRRVRAALRHDDDSLVPPVPAKARRPARVPGDPTLELDLFLAEVEKLTARTRRLDGPADLAPALRELVEAEAIQRATLWETSELREWGAADALRALGVELVSPQGPKREVAACELGITGADFALPETGTLVLRSGPDKPRMVSLLPRVHLALIRPTILAVDLGPVLEQLKQDDYFVFITGPSRTSDIELVTTVGVHGPRSLYVWVIP